MIQKYLSRFVSASLCVATLVLGTSAQMPNPYGAPITLEQAKKVAAPAMAEAAKNNWNMAVAIVDPSGNLVYYEKMDATQLGSANLAVEKARTAALFKRPSKTFQEAIPIEGGLPLVVEGKIAGAIGVSGGQSSQDGQCAKAGADAIK